MFEGVLPSVLGNPRSYTEVHSPGWPLERLEVYAPLKAAQTNYTTYPASEVSRMRIVESETTMTDKPKFYTVPALGDKKYYFNDPNLLTEEQKTHIARYATYTREKGYGIDYPLKQVKAGEYSAVEVGVQMTNLSPGKHALWYLGIFHDEVEAQEFVALARSYADEVLAL